MSKSVTRLFTQFQPENYTVTFKLDESAMRFSGTVTIRGKKVGRPSQRLTFHANGLSVSNATVIYHDKKGDREIALQRINMQKSMHEVRLHAEDMVFPGMYTVTMAFSAPISDGMTGIYPCYFKDGDVEKKLFATQFESHHAREAFPCIDEPEAKATFDMTLDTETGIEVLGNTPVSEQTKVDNRLITTFQTSPKMSTYLLAFVVGQLHGESAKTKSGVEVRTWTTIAQPIESVRFALDVAKKSIEYFEEYFGVPYPLAKADHVALPDFSSGAMENWGLITYRERVLLDYPGETSQSTREYIAMVIAHETSHQWFGNLVTMRWWDDLWLNESFANMMEYQAVDSMFPDWHIWNSFVASEGLSAFRRDATAGVQAVHVDVHHPDEISTLFDPSIVYAKGGRLLYMLKNYIGDSAFRTGLTAYFNTHAYGNTTGADLWDALSEASGKDIAAFMDPWLVRAGFPVVHVAQEGNSIRLSQEQFLDDRAKADPNRVWPVPLFANVSLDKDILATQSDSLRTTDKPVLLNTEGQGHYLVDYTSEKTKQYIETAIRKATLSEPARLLTLNASAMLSRAGFHSYVDTLQLLHAYEAETNESVWDIIAVVSSEVRRFIDIDESLEVHTKALSRELMQRQYKRLGWDEVAGESAADTKLRGLIISMGAYGDDAEILQTATDRFAAYVTGTSLPADLRPLIMSVPVKAGDMKAVEYLLQQHDESQNSELRGDIADALTTTRSQELAKQLLARLTDSKLIKPQDVDKWLVMLMRNRYTRDTAWQWMVDEWAWLEKTFGGDKSYDYLPRYAASVVNTRAYEKKYHELFESKLEQPMLTRNIMIGFEEISSRLAWLERDIQSIQTYFKQ